MLTREQRNRYLANGGVRCPFCDSEDVEGFGLEMDDDGVHQTLWCHDCEGEWTDIYKLVDVEDA